MSDSTLEIDASRLDRQLARLATFTHAEPAAEGTAVTRMVFTEDDLAARAWLRSLAVETGLAVREDAVGNLFFRLEGSEATLPAVATGSHMDAIPHAGMYDGTVGVLAGLEALRAIAAAGVKLKHSLEAVLFTSEEPTRFGIGCLGSRLLSGALAPERAEQLIDLLAAEVADAPRQTLGQVREQAGLRGSLASVRLEPGHYRAFLELHIEQGPLLERGGRKIGIVTSIAAPAAYRFEVKGQGGHAGALLMPDRRDALCAAAELILAVEKEARATGSTDTVATIGTCEVYPGAANSVPSRVTLQLDIRDTDAERRDMAMEAIRRHLKRIEQERRVTIREIEVNSDAPAACDPAIVQSLVTLCEAGQLPYDLMVSRAYHDSLFMARIAPMGMIFIPCREGISHRPEEYAAPEDIARGALLLAECLARLAT